MAERFPSFDIVAEEIRTQVDQQQRQFDALDTKAGVILGFSGVLMALTGDRQGRLTGATVLLAMLAVLLAVLAFYPHRFPLVDLSSLRNQYLSAESEFTAFRLLDSRLQMWRDGKKMLKLKARYLAGAILFLTAAAAVHAIAILL